MFGDLICCEHVWKKYRRNERTLWLPNVEQGSYYDYFPLAASFSEFLVGETNTLESGVLEETREWSDVYIKGDERKREKGGGGGEREQERKGGWVEERFKHHLTGLWIIVKRPLHDGSLNRTAKCGWVG